GPLAGSRHGHVVTQGVWLSRYFRAAGYDVTAVSASPNRYVRLLDITWTLLRRRRRIDILFLHVYGGARFVVVGMASWIGRRFDPVYSRLMAMQVLERLRTTHPEATLVMGGQDKGMQEEVERYARDRGLGDAVRLPGFLATERKLREGSAADIFINTSHVDNMPVAILEAGALGLPVVSTTVGGIADLLQEDRKSVVSGYHGEL